MCGFVGYAAHTARTNTEWLQTGCASLIHRGPDASGEWRSIDGRVGLAHRRLAILDLTDLGAQPMQLPNHGLVIVFNGEIYNWKELQKDLIRDYGWSFRSHCDTEVLLAAYCTWGESCVSKLNGMFSFAIYDSDHRRVFLARDRAGEKPLFYALNDGELRFASELKALFADPLMRRKINPLAMDFFLALGFVPGSLSIIEGVKKLPAGHMLSYDLDKDLAVVKKYWSLPSNPAVRQPQIAEESLLLEELEALLESAVRRQIVADVPVGVLLSVGVDSSLITALAARISERVMTFTVGFPGHGVLDETHHARLIADYFGTQHIELIAPDISAELLFSLARQFDEPIADSSMIPTYMVSHLVRQHCTVALGGDGGDELFGGYGHYNRFLRMEKNAGWIPIHIRRTLAMLGSVILPIGFKGRSWLQNFGIDWRRDWLPVPYHFDPLVRKRLIPALQNIQYTAEDVLSVTFPVEEDILERAMRMDFTNYLTEDILVKLDRSSMLCSLEMRAPFLDYQLIEFAFGTVPSRLKATMNNKKILPKRLAAKLLPTGFDLQRKQGFSIPLAASIQKGHLRDLFWDVLTDPSCLFDQRFIVSLLKGQDAGSKNAERLFALLMFELWRTEYGIEVF